MKNNLKALMLLSTLAGLLVGLGATFGGRSGASIGLFIAGAMNLGAYWFSDKIALKMSRARPVSHADAPALYDAVYRLAARAVLPMPSLHVIASDQPNAFATGRNPSHAAVAVTQGIMQQLTPDELEGVLAHELAHIRNRDILISSVAATIAAAISFIATMARWGAMFGGGDDDDSSGGFIVLIVASIVAPLSALFIQMGISRSREFHADRIGAEISGKPLGLANALRKIETYAREMPMQVNPSASSMFIINPLRGDLVSGLSRLFSTHPPTEERIRRLESM